MVVYFDDIMINLLYFYGFGVVLLTFGLCFVCGLLLFAAWLLTVC